MCVLIILICQDDNKFHPFNYRAGRPANEIIYNLTSVGSIFYNTTINAEFRSEAGGEPSNGNGWVWWDRNRS